MGEWQWGKITLPILLAFTSDPHNSTQHQTLIFNCFLPRLLLSFVLGLLLRWSTPGKTVALLADTLTRYSNSQKIELYNLYPLLSRKKFTILSNMSCHAYVLTPWTHTCFAGKPFYFQKRKAARRTKKHSFSALKQPHDRPGISSPWSHSDSITSWAWPSYWNCEILNQHQITPSRIPFSHHLTLAFSCLIYTSISFCHDLSKLGGLKQ